jgi:hypothetical protein
MVKAVFDEMKKEKQRTILQLELYEDVTIQVLNMTNRLQ